MRLGSQRYSPEDKACSFWQHRAVSIHWCHLMPELVTVQHCVAHTEKDLAAINRLCVKETHCKYSALAQCHFTPPPFNLLLVLDWTPFNSFIMPECVMRTGKKGLENKERKGDKKKDKTMAGSCSYWTDYVVCVSVM